MHHAPINEGGHSQRIMHGASRRAGLVGLAPAVKLVSGDPRRRVAERVAARLERPDVVVSQDALPGDVETYHGHPDTRAEDNTSALGVHIDIELRRRRHVAARKRPSHQHNFADFFRYPWISLKRRSDVGERSDSDNRHFSRTAADNALDG